MRLFVRIYTSLIRNDTQSVNIGQTARREASAGCFQDRETSGFFFTFFTRWQAHGRKYRRQTAAVLYQLILRLFMDVYFSNHTFTCSMLYSPVMTAVWSSMATNLTLS